MSTFPEEDWFPSFNEIKSPLWEFDNRKIQTKRNIFFCMLLWIYVGVENLNSFFDADAGSLCLKIDNKTKKCFEVGRPKSFIENCHKKLIHKMSFTSSKSGIMQIWRVKMFFSKYLVEKIKLLLYKSILPIVQCSPKVHYEHLSPTTTYNSNIW